jgi:DnaJ-class molecular chaperone
VARDSNDSAERSANGTSGRDGAGESHAPRECMACRGTGRVTSNLGGSPATVSCPWCEGRGVRSPGIDAQARWGQGDAEGAGAAPS